MMFRLTTIIALAGFVSANSYSIGCMSTLMNIAINPDVAGCLAPNLLLPLLVGAGNTADSVIPSVDSWVTAMCAQPACSDSVLSTLVTNVTNSCSQEFSLSNLQSTLDLVRTSYPAFRGAACLKDGSTNTMCTTEILQNMQSDWGTLSLNQKSTAAIVSGVSKGLPSNVLCTNCAKGIFTYIQLVKPGTFSNSSITYATKTCGATFNDGGMPPGLIQTGVGIPVNSTMTNTTGTAAPVATTSATPTASPVSGLRNGAFGGPSSAPLLNLAVSGLVIVFTGMSLL